MKKILILFSLMFISFITVIQTTYAYTPVDEVGLFYRQLDDPFTLEYNYHTLPQMSSYTFGLVNFDYDNLIYEIYEVSDSEIDLFGYEHTMDYYPSAEPYLNLILYGSMRISGFYEQGTGLESYSFVSDKGFQLLYNAEWNSTDEGTNNVLHILDFTGDVLHSIDITNVNPNVTTFTIQPLDLTNPVSTWEVGNSTLTEITSNYFGLEMGLINDPTPATTIAGLASLLYNDFDSNYGPNSNHTYIFDVYNASLLRTNPSIPNIYLPSIALLIWEYEKDYDGVIVKENLYMYSREGHQNWQIDYINAPEDFNITVPNDQYTLGYNEGRASVEIINERLREREYQRGYTEARNYFGKYIDVNDIWVPATLWGNSEYQRGLQASNQESYDEGYRVGANESFLGSLDTWIVPAIFIVIVVGGFFALRGRREN